MRLKPNPWRLLLLLAGSSAFVAGGIFELNEGHRFVGWATICFFSLGIVGAIFSFVPGAQYLDLTNSGMEICKFHRKWFIRWVDVQDFYTVSLSGRKIVGWRYSASFTPRSNSRKLNRSVIGADAVVVPGIYGLSADALATLLNEWRARCSVAP